MCVCFSVPKGTNFPGLQENMGDTFKCPTKNGWRLGAKSRNISWALREGAIAPPTAKNIPAVRPPPLVHVLHFSYQSLGDERIVLWLYILINSSIIRNLLDCICF